MFGRQCVDVSCLLGSEKKSVWKYNVLLIFSLQLLRKRHIGNDIVTVIFQEPGALPFTAKSVRSQFQHVFIVVRVLNPNTENVAYR